jgi:hypothetical protein
MSSVSVPVPVDQLADAMADVGGDPYLVTVSPEGSAHVVSVRARVDGAHVVVTAGRTSRANASSCPDVTLLWPAASGADYSLIVDGPAAVAADSDDIAIVPTRAVLHRVAGASDDIPGCIAIEATT